MNFLLRTSLLFAFCVSLFGEENFLLIREATDEVVLEFGSDSDQQVTPCCSFNIALSLMGFDSGVLQDTENPTWDFQEEDLIDSWKVPHNPQSWMKNSCFWYSQILARKLGLERIQNYLELFEYGNQDMSGGLKSAWLCSSLEISPQEQVHFIQKMLREELPISKRAIALTKSLLFMSELPDGGKLFGKVGLGDNIDEGGSEVAWLVGWVEKGGEVFLFAYNIHEPKIDGSKIRPRVKELLVESLKLDGI